MNKRNLSVTWLNDNIYKARNNISGILKELSDNIQQFYQRSKQKQKKPFCNFIELRI